MPNFLKTLFKPSPSRRSQRAGPLPPGVGFFSPRPSPSGSTSSDADLESMVRLLRDKLEGQGESKDTQALLEAIRDHPDGGDETMRQLIDVLQKTYFVHDATVTPFQDDTSARADATSVLARTGKGKRGLTKFEGGYGDQWSGAFEACTGALALARKLLKSSMAKSSKIRGSLERMCSLMDAQREELLDIRPYAEDHALSTLRTLKEIYLKVEAGLEEAKSMVSADASETLAALVQVLIEGPDYLIDVSIIEAVVWQAEVIDSNFGGEVRQILDQTVAEHPKDPATFRRAAENIIGISSALPRDVLDDTEGIDAYKAIGLLVKQLQMRLGSATEETTASSQAYRLVHHRHVAERTITPAGTPLTVSAAPSPMATPLTSPLGSPSASRATTLDSDFQTFVNASDLEAMYGTGPIATPSKNVSLAPTPATPATPRGPPSPADTDTESEPEIWEYRGNLLTRSALSLVMRQEALARADSSGQYAGEVSWDDVRNAWIPKWAEKLKEEDVAEEEIPTTNPAEYKVKRKDAWGNTIGWREGGMFYVDDPSFDTAL